MFDNFDDLDLVYHSTLIAEERLQHDGNIIQPLIIALKDGCVQDIQCTIPEETLDSLDIRNKVVETIKNFIVEVIPEEVVIIREGFFEGDASKKRYLSLIHSSPTRERTWITPIYGKEIGSWKEIKVLDGDLYNLFEKSFAPWN